MDGMSNNFTNPPVKSCKDLIGNLYKIHNPIELKKFVNAVDSIENKPEFDGRFSKYKIESDNWTRAEKKKKQAINNISPVLVTDAWEKNMYVTKEPGDNFLQSYYVVRFLHEGILWEVPIDFGPVSKTSYYKPWKYFFRTLTKDD